MNYNWNWKGELLEKIYTGDGGELPEVRMLSHPQNIIFNSPLWEPQIQRDDDNCSSIICLRISWLAKLTLVFQELLSIHVQDFSVSTEILHGESSVGGWVGSRDDLEVVE
jgi:hypothetical protein